MIGHPKQVLRDLEVGAERRQVVVESLSRTQIVQYAGGSGDFNPIHHDEPFATGKAGYPSVFAHGMLSMGLTARILTDWLGDGVLRSYGVRFVKQVWPGDTLTAVATVRAQRDTSDAEGAASSDGEVELDVVALNQHGETVVSGSATAVLPLEVIG